MLGPAKRGFIMLVFPSDGSGVVALPSVEGRSALKRTSTLLTVSVSSLPLTASINFTRFMKRSFTESIETRKSYSLTAGSENMNAKITIIYPKGGTVEETRDPSDIPTLEELQKAVGGLIESVDAYLPEGTQAYANEEGVLLGLEPNPTATELLAWPYMILGPVVILEGFDSENGEDSYEM
jgi:hypothetical protein